jgi:hypothetical protein
MTDFKEMPNNKEHFESKIKEYKDIETNKVPDVDYKNVLKEQRYLIESVPLESLQTMNDKLIKDASDIKQGLTDDEKTKVKDAHPDWPDSIIEAISSWKEYEIYDKAGLVYAEINGKPCLIRSDIDLNQKDEYGRTNKERMENGLSPLNKNGETIELHHIGQKADSPLAELTQDEHRGKGNDGILHDKNKETEIDREEFSKERNAHWRERATNA